MTKPAKKKQNKIGKQKELNIFSAKIIFSVALIILAVVISYHPALDAGFTNWDDDKYILNNSDILHVSKANIQKFFSESYMGNYHPLTMLSYAVDHDVAKLRPGQYHFTNILFHAFNSLLVFWLVLVLMKRWECAFMAGLLFAVHTLHVESVAWVSERKDVLYAFFYFLSLIFYVNYVKRKRALLYIAALLIFILSVLSKGMAVTLCLTLIAIDFYLGRNLKSKTVILEKIPFVIIAFVMGLVAIHSQQINASNEKFLNLFSIGQRIVIGGYGFIEYIFKLVLPVQLSHFYPYPSTNGTLPLKCYIYFFIFLAFAFCLAYAFIKKKISKDILFCFLFFLIAVFPVLQIFPVGEAIMADRYIYVASAGFFIFAGSMVESVFKTNYSKVIYFSLITLYAVLLISFTRERCKVWKNSISLWDDMIIKYPAVPLAYNNRGIAKADAMKFDDAIADYRKAIAIDSTFFKAYYNMGLSKYQTRKLDEAIDHFNQAIKLDPDNPNYYSDKGLAESELKNNEAAMRDYEKAIALDKKFHRAYYNMGVLKFNTGKNAEACDYFFKAKEFGNKDAQGIIEKYCR